MAHAAEAPTGKKIGTTAIGATAGATAGGQVGFALADVIVELLQGTGLDLGPVENSLGIVISAVLAVVIGLLAGKLIPTNQVRVSDPVLIPVPQGAAIPAPESPIEEEEEVVYPEYPESLDGVDTVK